MHDRAEDFAQLRPRQGAQVCRVDDTVWLVARLDLDRVVVQPELHDDLERFLSKAMFARIRCDLADLMWSQEPYRVQRRATLPVYITT